MSKQKYFTEEEKRVANNEKAKRYYERNRKKVCRNRTDRYKAAKRPVR